MSGRHHSRLLAALVAVPLVVVLAGCGENDKAKAEKQAAAPCPGTITHTVSTAPPSDAPAPNGTAYEYSSQGKTRIWFFAVDGSAGQLPSLRDGYDRQLTAKSYQIDRTDQEKGAEAESEFSGPHSGTTNFRPLCVGKVVFRLTLHS